MRQRSFKAFFIALLLYLPVLLLFVQLQRDWGEPNASKGEEARYISLQSLTRAPEAAPVAAQPSNGQAQTVKPPIAAVSNEEAEGTQAPRPLSPQELSAAFAPQSLPAEAPVNPNTVVPATELGDLYGLMLFELTEEERKFLENQLGPIGVITQRYLRYPALAGQLRMSGETVVAFTLLPGGDITPIEIVKSSGYSLLDDNAVHTVEVAHKDYPHPAEPVRIRMRVIYRLF